jgi:hypothetical protein
MTSEEMNRALFSQGQFHPAETSVFLELYKIHVDTMERVMARRIQTGALFLTVDSLLFAGMGFCVNAFSTTSVAMAGFTVIGLGGFFTSLTSDLLT